MGPVQPREVAYQLKFGIARSSSADLVRQFSDEIVIYKDELRTDNEVFLDLLKNILASISANCRLNVLVLNGVMDRNGCMHYPLIIKLVNGYPGLLSSGSFTVGDTDIRVQCDGIQDGSWLDQYIAMGILYPGTPNETIYLVVLNPTTTAITPQELMDMGLKRGVSVTINSAESPVPALAA